MKTSVYPIRFVLLAVSILVGNTSFTQQQGKVVINEYMPWTSNGCGTTAEFVELLNFGPGPVDIGCYILTTGVYSITIPKNTIIYPGQFYVLAGRDFIGGNCANIDSSGPGVHANLNWNTCNCTNVAIPTTGDGMMTDGGASNTPLVLLDPSLKIVDAVVRSLPTESVQTITSSSAAGDCTAKTFNIGSMNPAYEILGMSAGRGNSFARRVDGDCEWVKDPQQSAHATNNRSGETSNINYTLNMVNSAKCEGTDASAVIFVSYSNYASIFPMTYVLAQDLDNNGSFDLTDKYDTYQDNTPPYIEINNLPVGHFKVTVSSSNGCFLKTFEFTIVSCNPGVLPVQLVYFKNRGLRANEFELEWKLGNVQSLQAAVVERAGTNGSFFPEKTIINRDADSVQVYRAKVPATPAAQHFRLKLMQKTGGVVYSPAITTDGLKQDSNNIWPNPTTGKLYLELKEWKSDGLLYSIYNAYGSAVIGGVMPVGRGTQTVQFSLPNIPMGIYRLQVSDRSHSEQPISFRFVKH